MVAVLVTRSTAVRLPATDGAKRTRTEQVGVAAPVPLWTVVPVQSSEVSRKSSTSPETSLALATVTRPEAGVTTTGVAAPIVPRAWVPKSTGDAESAPVHGEPELPS